MRIGFVWALAALAATAAEAVESKVVKDTTVGEGLPFKITVTIVGTANSYWWSWVEGYKYKILDPESKTLSGTLPRVSKAGEYIRFRFSAKVKDSVHTQDVIFRIKDDVPDPQFAFTPPRYWDGAVIVDVKPTIANLLQIRTCRHPTLRYAWYADSVPVDTAWKDSAMTLKSASASGRLSLRLCLDNGGAATCKGGITLVQRPATSLLPAGRSFREPTRPVPFRRADGRLSAPGVGPAAVFPRIRIAP